MLSIRRPPPTSTLFPYTTLFRSVRHAELPVEHEPPDQADHRVGRRHRNDEAHARHRTHPRELDRKSTRLNSSHVERSYAVFCLKKKRWATAGVYLSSVFVQVGGC